MAEQDELRITVSLIDNASAGLASLRRGVQGLGQDASKELAPLKGGFEGVSKAIKEVTGGHTAAQFEVFKRSQIDMARIIKEGTDITLGGEKAMLGFVGKIGVAGAAIASLGTLAVAAAESNKKWADSVVEFHNKATLLGTDDANLMVMQKNLEKLHIPKEDLDQGLVSLQKLSAALRNPASEQFQRLWNLAGPRFAQSFQAFTDHLQKAQNEGEQFQVLQEGMHSFGETAAQDERARQEAEIKRGERRIINEREIMNQRKAGERFFLQTTELPASFALWPKMEMATDAQKARQAEILKNAEQMHTKFFQLEEDMGRLFTLWQTGAGAKDSWLSKSIDYVDQGVKTLERDLVGMFGTEAQQRELREREIKEAKEKGLPPPEPLPQFSWANVGKETLRHGLELGRLTNPIGVGAAAATEGILGHDPLGLKLQEKIDEFFRLRSPDPGALRPQWPTPAPTAPLAPPAPPAPQPPLAPAYPQLGIPALPGAVPTPPIRPLRFTGGGEDDGPGRLSTNIEDRRDPRAMQRGTAVWTGGLRDHERVLDQNTDQLKTLNDQLSRMIEPQPEEDGGRPTFRAPDSTAPN